MPAVRAHGDSQVNGVITPKPRQRTELKCQFCEKSYFKTEHLLRHERSHTKEKPFQCTSCGKNFGRRDALLRHLRHSSRLHKSVGETNGMLLPWTVAETSFHSSRDSEASVITSIGQQMTNDSPRRDDQQLQVSEEIAVSEVDRVVSRASHNNDPWAPLETQPWWLEQDLNLEAFDTSLFDPSGLDEPWFQPLNLDLVSERVTPMLSDSVGQEFIDSNVQKAWFTYVGGPYNRDVSKLFNGVEPECQQELNDSYDLGASFRARVSKRLNTQQNTDPLPSTPYLNQSVKTYFTKVIPLFPIIHSQTFKPSRENSLLLIIMCSLGSIVHGTGISHHGTRIFERFNKALLASWETTLLSNPEESVALIQAAFLGQMFGILSGNPQHLAVADALHGTIIAWARRSKLFSHIPPRIEREDLEDPQLGSAKLEDGWRCWGKSESILRTILGLYILDSHLATVFHHDPLLRHDSMETQRPADDELFDAPTAQEWKSRMLNNIPKRVALHRCLHINLSDHSPLEPQTEERLCNNNRLTAYCVLQSISAMISESRTRDQVDYGSKKFNEICDTLICWYSTYELPNLSSQDTDLLGLTVLWHATFMKLLTNFDKVERALGRDGADTQYLEDDISYTLEWASSISADRCILHAQVIQETLCQMSLNTDPAIHIPHCAFMAGIACYSTMHFRRPARRARFGSTFPPTISRQPSELPEFNIRGKFSPEHMVSSAPVLFENHIGEQLMRTIGEPREVHHVGPDIFRLCYDVLDRMGHCGNAKRYGDTLLALIRPEIEKWAVMG